MKITSMLAFVGLVGSLLSVPLSAKADYLSPCLWGERTSTHDSWGYDNWYKVSNHCSEIVNFHITVHYTDGSSQRFTWTLAGGTSWDIYLGKRQVLYAEVTTD